MSRNGVAKTAPFWMMRIVPRCSRTRNRLLEPVTCTKPTGSTNPLANWVSAAFTGPGGGGGGGAGLFELPPQLRLATARTTATDTNANFFQRVCMNFCLSVSKPNITRVHGHEFRGRRLGTEVRVR